MGNTVTPGYFGAIRIPLVAGRDFTWRDRAEAPGVAIVNQAAARRFWNGNAIGQRIDVPGQNDRWRTVEVVGVVRDSKYWTLGEAVQPTLYTPYAQGLNGNTLAVRTTNMEGTAAALRAELRRRAPDRPVELQRMSDAVAIAVLPARIGALVTTAFAAVAMFLAVMGIYALVAFGVALRLREIGIRKAVGARTRDIAGVLLAGSAPPVLAGLVLGIAAGSLIAFSFGGLVVGVPPYDPAVLAAVTAVVSGTSLAAGFVPAWRAARVDPLVALRPD
jgi:putative ABC transport system permease protein